MKICTGCRETKPISEFSKNKKGKFGVKSKCKSCCSTQFKQWRAKNIERERQRSKEWYRNNREHEFHRMREWQRRNRDKTRAWSKRWREANPEKARLIISQWSKVNRNKCNAAFQRWFRRNKELHYERVREWSRRNWHKCLERAARRRAAQRNQTPSWLTDEHRRQMQAIYAQASPGEHVDHIWPLRGKDAWGLHVPWNLQILPAEINLKKSNKPPEVCHGRE